MLFRSTNRGGKGIIDLTRQAGAASTGSLLLTSTAVTSSVTGLYEVEWGKLNPTYALGQGDLTLGEGNKLSVGYLELENNIIYDSGSREAIVLTGGGSPESDMGALRKEKEKITVHPFVRIL